MNQSTHPSQFVGTWEWIETFLKSGAQLPPQPANIPKVAYTFAADGTGTMMPGTIASMSMRWAVADGQLIMKLSALKKRDTNVYEFPDAETLVLVDRHGGRNVFKRRPGQGE